MKRLFALPILIVVAAAALATAQPMAPPAAAEAPEIAAAPPAPPVPPLAALPVAPSAPAITAQAPPAPAAPPARPSPAARPVPPVPPAPPAPMVNVYAWGKGSYLGIGVQEVDTARAKELKLPEERGVEVTTVSEDSPAAKAGIKEGDVVLEYNGERVEGVEGFVRMVRETPPGRRARLLVSRNGASLTLTATVGDRKQFSMDPKFQRDWEKWGEEMGHQFGPDSRFQQDLQNQFGPDSKFQRDMQKLQEDLGRMQFDVPDVPVGPMALKNRALGIEAESVNSQLADFFGVKQGVLVRSVVKDSPAEKAGIKAGDVITRMGDTDVSRPGDISRIIREAEAGKTVPASVVRNKQHLTLNVTVEPKPESSGGMGPRRLRAPRHEFLPRTPLIRGRLVALPSTAL